MNYSEYTYRQSLEFTDTYQLHLALQDALNRSSHYVGSMHWKTIRGHQYLYRMFDGYGQGKSLGPRSEKTEGIYHAFQQGKADSGERIRSIKQAMDEKAALNRAVGLHRVPRIAGRIVRELEKQKLLGNRVIVVGTNAIYAYEALAGVMVHRELMATADVDFLWDNREKVQLAGEEGINGFLSILKKADRSFERTAQLFRAVNKDGYMADLIVPEANHPLDPAIEQMGDAYDLKASGIGSVRWLVNSPKVEAIVIDDRGYPFQMVVPDPRSFAIHKLWLSQREQRSIHKAKRDREQALTVASLIIDRLQQFRFEMEQLKMFPKEIAERGMNEIGSGGD